MIHFLSLNAYTTAVRCNMKSYVIVGLVIALMITDVQSKNENGDEVFARVGENVEIPCHLSEDWGQCSWQKGAKKLIILSSEHYSFTPSSIDGFCNLTINGVRKEDEDTWTCRFKKFNSGPPLKGPPVSLIVNEKLTTVVELPDESESRIVDAVPPNLDNVPSYQDDLTQNLNDESRNFDVGRQNFDAEPVNSKDEPPISDDFGEQPISNDFGEPPISDDGGEPRDLDDELPNPDGESQNRDDESQNLDDELQNFDDELRNFDGEPQNPEDEFPNPSGGQDNPLAEHMTAVLGKGTSLPCKVNSDDSNYELTRCTWSRNDKTIEVSNNYEYSLGHETCALGINKVTEEDAASWVCAYDMSFGDINLQDMANPIILRVEQIPKTDNLKGNERNGLPDDENLEKGDLLEEEKESNDIEDTEAKLSVSVGLNLTVLCQITDVSGDCSWQKGENTFIIEPSEHYVFSPSTLTGNCDLTIVNAVKDDETTWRCINRNFDSGIPIEGPPTIVTVKDGTENTTVEALQNGKPESPRARSGGDSDKEDKLVFDVNAGDNITLPCQLSDDWGKCTWQKEGNKPTLVWPSDHYLFHSSSFDGTCHMTIISVNKEDEGSWICKFQKSNKGNRSSAPAIEVIVKGKQPTALPTEEITNESVESTSAVVTTSSSTVNDDEDAEEQPNQQPRSDVKDMTVILGRSIILPCKFELPKSSSYFPGQCKWKRNDETIREFPGKYDYDMFSETGSCTLLILNALMEDNAAWTCSYMKKNLFHEVVFNEAKSTIRLHVFSSEEESKDRGRNFEAEELADELEISVKHDKYEFKSDESAPEVGSDTKSDISAHVPSASHSGGYFPNQDSFAGDEDAPSKGKALQNDSTETSPGGADQTTGSTGTGGADQTTGSTGTGGTDKSTGSTGTGESTASESGGTTVSSDTSQTTGSTGTGDATTGTDGGSSTPTDGGSSPGTVEGPEASTSGSTTPAKEKSSWVLIIIIVLIFLLIVVLLVLLIYAIVARRWCFKKPVSETNPEMMGSAKP